MIRYEITDKQLNAFQFIHHHKTHYKPNHSVDGCVGVLALPIFSIMSSVAAAQYYAKGNKKEGNLHVGIAIGCLVVDAAYIVYARYHNKRYYRYR